MTLITKPHGDLEAHTSAEAATVNDQINTIYSDYNGEITDANISSTAAIAKSKLNLASQIMNADVSPSAAIAQSKLALSISPPSGSLLGDLRRINAGPGLTGGGYLTADLTLSQVADSIRQLTAFLVNGVFAADLPALNIATGAGITVSLSWVDGNANYTFSTSNVPNSALKSTTSTVSGTINNNERLDFNLGEYAFMPNINSAAAGSGKTVTICSAYLDGGQGSGGRFALYNDTGEALAYSITWRTLTS